MRHILLMTCALACPMWLQAQQTAQQQESESRWKQDIAALVSGMSARGSLKDPKKGVISREQKDFRKLYPPQRFEADISSLETHLGAWPDAKIVLELTRIIAAAHVAHNLVKIPDGMGFEQRIPVSFTWFPDGLIVSSATPAYKALIGRRVTAVGSMTPEALQSSVETYVSFENAGWARARATRFMSFKPILDELGLVGPGELVAITFAAQGTESVVQFPFVADPKPMLDLYEGIGIPVPLRDTHVDRNYWYQWLAESETAYLQYRACTPDARISFQEFTRATLADLESRPLKRIVIDLRNNRGGNSELIRPLLDGLSAHPQWKNKLFVLIGPNTFSSGVLNAMELKDQLGATLIGEPTGGKPGSYGEIELLKLPNSGLSVYYTSKFFRAPKGMKADAVLPDIPVKLTFHDVRTGLDPTLVKAIAEN